MQSIFSSIRFGVYAMVIALGTSAAYAQTSVWSLADSRLQFYDTGASAWTNYNSIIPTVTSSPLTNGIKMYGYGTSAPGAAFQITGDFIAGSPDPNQSATNRLHLTGTATLGFSNWDTSTLSIPTSFAYDYSLDGGTFTFSNAETGFTLKDGGGESISGVGSGFGDPPVGDPVGAGSYPDSFQFVDNFNGNPTGGASIDWEVNIYFSWTPSANDDTLTFTIPNNSIDIQIVPEPAMAGAFGLLALGAIRRRR